MNFHTFSNQIPLEKSRYNPLFIKTQSFFKILQKYLNKNFLSQKSLNPLVKEIKLQTCKILEFLLNYRFEYYLNIAMGYFNEKFLKENTIFERKKEISENLLMIFPEEIEEITEDFNRKNTGVLPKNGYFRSFDDILNKPFIEVLLISFYFNSNDKELSNSISNLMIKYCNQKGAFRGFFKRIELLITEEDKTLYQSLQGIVKKLNNNFFKIQVFLMIFVINSLLIFI